MFCLLSGRDFPPASQPAPTCAFVHRAGLGSGGARRSPASPARFSSAAGSRLDGHRLGRAARRLVGSRGTPGHPRETGEAKGAAPSHRGDSHQAPRQASRLRKMEDRESRGQGQQTPGAPRSTAFSRPRPPQGAGTGRSLAAKRQPPAEARMVSQAGLVMKRIAAGFP